MTASQPNQFAQTLLEQAKELEAEKKALYEKMGANRTILRELVKTGTCNKAQEEAVAAFYPAKAKSDKKADATA